MASPDEWPMGVGEARDAHRANRADVRVAEVEGGEAGVREAKLRAAAGGGATARRGVWRSGAVSEAGGEGGRK